MRGGGDEPGGGRGNYNQNILCEKIYFQHKENNRRGGGVSISNTVRVELGEKHLDIIQQRRKVPRVHLRKEFILTLRFFFLITLCVEKSISMSL